MKLNVSLVAAAVAASLFASGVQADTRKRSVAVPSGDTTRLFVHSNYGNDCRAGTPPGISLLKKPAHGQILVGESIEVVNRDGHACNAKKIKGTGVFYKPDPGYRGPDRVVYRRGSSSSPFDMDVAITVK